MPIIDAETKTQRLEALLRLACQRPGGFTTRAVAAELGVQERTARRYIVELAGTGRLPVETVKGVWRLIEGGQMALAPLHLNLNEALAVYLAVRLLSGYSDKSNPHAVEALRKLSSATPPAIGEHIRRTAGGAAGRRKDEAYVARLETLAQAWAERRRVRFRYVGAGKNETTERQVDPYFIEPSAIGFSCYLIGYDHTRAAIRIFKVERMGPVYLMDHRFEPDSGFDPYRYLENAWGIMGGDEVIDVRLRFSEAVRERVYESDWPGMLTRDDLPGGGCLLTLRVAHYREMLPWIRGWGPDCEVLEPEELRGRIAGDMRKAAAVYGKAEGQNR